MATPETFKMGAVGDINLKDFATDTSPFANLLPYLGEMDLSVGTLEGLLAPPEELYYKKGFTHVGEGHAPNLAGAGFRLLNLASNVTFGEPAIRTTLDQLDAEGIAHAGAGLDREGAYAAAVVEAGERRVGMISRTAVFWPYGHVATDEQAGVAPMRVTTSYRPHPRLIELPGAPATVLTEPDPADVAELRADIARLRKEVDVLVAFFHFGVSSQREVADYQRTLAHASIEAGADVVLGSHAHVIQPIEVYQGRPIFYGLSQVIFGWDFVARVKHPGGPGLVAELEIDGEGRWRWSGRFVKPDEESLEPRFVGLDEVPDDVAFLTASSGDVVSFAGDRLLVDTDG